MDICNKLTQVHFDSFANVTMPIVQRLHSVCPNLEIFNLKGSLVATDAVHYVLDHFMKFEKLVLHDCDVKEEIRLLKKPKLDIQ
jgi:hypothetical protein